MIYFKLITNLDKIIYQQINHIFKLCTEHDHINYELPSFKEFSSYSELIIAQTQDELIGFIWNTDTTLVEAFGMVCPKYRNQGVFTEMIVLLQKENAIKPLTFYGKSNYTLAPACMSRLGFYKTQTELLMSFDKGNDKEWTDYVEEENEHSYYYIGDELIGHYSTLETEHSICIYDVFVYEKHRNKGYGKALIKDFLWNYVNSGKEIILHVSSQNIPAIKCYQSCGFVIKESIDYYAKKQYKRQPNEKRN